MGRREQLVLSGLPDQVEERRDQQVRQAQLELLAQASVLLERPELLDPSERPELG